VCFQVFHHALDSEYYFAAVSFLDLFNFDYFSLNRQPADLFEVLTVMSREQRNITPEMMPLEGGRSFLTAWLSPVAAESKQGNK